MQTGDYTHNRVVGEIAGPILRALCKGWAWKCSHNGTNATCFFSLHFAGIFQATKNPAQAKPGRVERIQTITAGWSAGQPYYSTEASTVSSVADAFWARSSASALLSRSRYPTLLPWRLIPDRK